MASSKRKLRIAVFSANEFAVPPSLKMKDIYAPLWLVHYITEGLVKRGHKVTLFAASNSKTKAKLISANLPSLATNKKMAPFYKQVSELEKEASDIEFYKKLVARKGTVENYEYILISELYKHVLKGKFDLVYISLIGLRPLPFAALSSTPTVLSLNNPLDPFTLYFMKEYKKRAPQIHYVGISKNQIKSAPSLFDEVIYNGVDLTRFKFNEKPQNMLITAGRISDNKGVSEAIEVAKKTNYKLVFAGRHYEDDYWNKVIKPKIGGKIKYAGVLPYQKMPSFYKQAKAFLFPIKWEEPFGLVMIEAMATGTPVIAFRRGSVPEIVKDGKTGFIVDTVDEMVEAVGKIDQISRRVCREHVEKKFSIEAMVDNYEKLFYKIVKK